MVTKIIFALGVASVAMLALAVIATGLVGVAVWVGGSAWARRDSR